MFDFKIFKPYQILSQNEKFLHLVEPPLRKKLLFSFFILYPILIVMGLICLLILFTFPIKIKLILISLILVVLMIFSKKRYIIEVIISDVQIHIKSFGYAGLQSEDYLITDVEEIRNETFLFNGGGGFKYTLKMKNSNKSILFIAIPYLYLQLGNREKINKVLEFITGIKVIKY